MGGLGLHFVFRIKGEALQASRERIFSRRKREAGTGVAEEKDRATPFYFSGLPKRGISLISEILSYFYAMPNYDYVCRECGHEMEVFQSMKAEPLRDCPECGKPALQRLIGAGAGLIFKGSGFYITDYKNKSPEGSKAEGKDSSLAKGEASTGKSSNADSKKVATTAANPNT